MKIPFKKWFENWFHCNELKEITNLLNDARQSTVNAEKGKENFVKRATLWLAQHEENEKLGWQRYLLSLNPIDVFDSSKKPDPDFITKKIDVIIEMLSERKKDILEKRSNSKKWVGIGFSVFFSFLSIFTSIFLFLLSK